MLQWSFKEKVGTAILKNEVKGIQWKVNLYEGNAYLIFVWEYKENKKSMYQVINFFVDKVHMQNCLGLKKGYDVNLMDDEYLRLKKITFDKVGKHTKEVIEAMTKANFTDLTITIRKRG